METGFEQFLSLPKKTPLCWISGADKSLGLLGQENNSEGSSGFDEEVEPVDDFLLGISLSFNSYSSSSFTWTSIVKLFFEIFSLSLLGLK